MRFMNRLRLPSLGRRLAWMGAWMPVPPLSMWKTLIASISRSKQKKLCTMNDMFIIRKARMYTNTDNKQNKGIPSVLARSAVT